MRSFVFVWLQFDSFARFVFGVAEILGNGSIAFAKRVMISYPILA
jgi:hypothetical protein